MIDGIPFSVPNLFFPKGHQIGRRFHDDVQFPDDLDDLQMNSLIFLYWRRKDSMGAGKICGLFFAPKK